MASPRPEVEAAWRRGIGVWVVLTLAFGGLLLVVLVRSGSGAAVPPPIGDVDGALAVIDAGALDAEDGVCASFEACEAQCAAGEVAACVDVADRLRAGRGVKPDPAAAMLRYHALCAPGDALACTRLALVADLADDRTFAADWVEPTRRPAALLRAACATGATRGRLACAAQTLANATDAPSGLCDDPTLGTTPRACAKAIALRACMVERNPEACALAIDGSVDGDPAAAVLRVQCDLLEPDRAACFYLAAASADVDARDRALLRACPEVGDGLAAACRQRAALSTIPNRAAELRARACSAGWCLDQPVKTTAELLRARTAFDTACTAGQPSGCAHLLYVDRQENVSLWNRQVARAAAAAPAATSPAPTFADVPVKVARLVSACQLGAAVACDAAASYLTAHAGTRLANDLRALAATLRDPVPGLAAATPPRP